MSRQGVLVMFLVGAAICRPAAAADLPADRAVPAPPSLAQPFSWTGPYFGASAGYGWADPRGSLAITSASLAAEPPIIPVIDAVGSQALALRGGIFGVEAGYNWQLSNLVVLGVEGEFDGSDVTGSHVVGGLVPNLGLPYTISQAFRIDWQASLRARAGFTPIDRLLIYATVGPALANLNYSSTYADSIPEIESASFRATKAGFVVGVGGEYALGAHWSVKAEYLFSRFCAASGTGSVVLTDGTTAYVAHSTGALDENSLRFGVNYHFD